MGAKLHGPLAECLAKTAGEVAGFHESAACRDLSDRNAAEAFVAEQPAGAVETQPHQFVAEGRTRLREQIVQIALGDAMSLRDGAGVQVPFMAPIPDGA